MGIKDGKVIAEYESMREAERQTNIAHSSIKKAITGKLKNAGGFQWEYKKNDYLCVAINIFIHNKIVLSGNKYISVVIS